MDTLRFSRCRSGKNWFWVVSTLERCWGDEDAVSSGIAETPEAALEAAAVVAGPLVLDRNWLAEHYRRRQAAIKRSQRKSDADGSAPIELVYECHWYLSQYYDDPTEYDSITPHRIVKKTKKRLYVEKERYYEDRPSEGWRNYAVETFILDRKEFESTGKAKRASRGWWDNNVYYATPEMYYRERQDTRATSPKPDCFAGLGLLADATADDVRRAYKKLARQHHPDRGGDPAEFKQVVVWYEQAMAIVS